LFPSSYERWETVTLLRPLEADNLGSVIKNKLFLRNKPTFKKELISRAVPLAFITW
jgi:hypothetical protein